MGILFAADKMPQNILKRGAVSIMRVESACKPSSVLQCSDSHSSTPTIARRFQRSTRLRGTDRTKMKAYLILLRAELAVP